MKYILISVYSFLLLSVSSWAQPLNSVTPETMIQSAEKAMSSSNFYKALELYEKAFAANEDQQLLVKMAELNYKLRDFENANNYYRKYFKSGVVTDPKQKFYYGRSLKMVGNYVEAIKQLDAFMASPNEEKFQRLATAERKGAKSSIGAKPDENCTIRNAGANLNSKSSEYSPFLASDGNLYFSSLMDANIVELDKSNREEFGTKILVASKAGDGFEKPRRLSENVNRKGYFNSNVTLSDDATEMIFCRQLLSNGNKLIESKLFRSTLGDNGWSPAKPLESINKDYLVKAPSYGELFGKTVLFFAADNTGGYGGYDIYYADYIGEGKFGEARNLGETINTVGDEDSPFYQNGKLYFSSTGHSGFGGYDVFSSKWNAQNWSNPTNLGLPINSCADDLYFALEESGFNGYLVSNRSDAAASSLKSATCCNDIYQFEIKRIEVDLLAKTIDQKSQMALNGAKLKVVPTSEIDYAAIQEKNNKTGNDFEFELELNKTYWVIAMADGYYNDTIKLNTTKILASTTFERKLSLMPIPPAEPVKPEPTYVTITTEKAFTLENIYYDYNDDKITKSAEQDLNLLYDLMATYPTMVIELSSHTDSRGGKAYNENLSQRRAESARTWLISKGVNADRIVAKGYGMAQPKVVSEKMAQKQSFLNQGQVLNDEFINQLGSKDLKEIAHQANRRTEFKIIGGPTSIKLEEKELIDPSKN